MSVDDERRRSLLLAGATTLTGALAGCTGILDGESTGEPTDTDEPTDTATATATTTAEPLDLPVAGEPQSIEYGETVTGELTREAPSDPEFNGFYEPWVFTGSQGDYATISMSSTSGDTYVYLLDENGSVIAQNDDISTSLNSEIPFTELPADGHYIILAGSFSNDVGFDYELSLTTASGDSQDLREISVGETATGEIGFDDPNEQRYAGFYEPVTLQVETDQRVTIEMTAADGDTLLGVLDESGSVIGQNDDSGEGGLNSRIRGVSVSAGTEYTIVAASFGENEVFEYELSVSEAEPAIDLREIEIGQTRNGEIDSQDPHESRFNGPHEPVRFQGEAGQYVDIEMRSGTGDTYLFLMGPSGSIVAENDDAGASLDSAIQNLELPETGEYIIIASSFSGGTFRYELSLTEGTVPVDLRSIEVGETATGGIDRTDPQSSAFRGYYEPVTFTVDSAMTVDVRMTAEDGDTYLMLVDSNMSVLAENDDTASSLNSAIEGVQLPAAGEYTIIATSFTESATFGYELTLEQA